MHQRQANLFFTVDTLLAILIIVGAFLIIQSSFASPTLQEDPQQTLLQISKFFRETTVGELQTEYPNVYSPPAYESQADPWRSSQSLYQELLYLLQEHNNTIAEEFLANVTRVQDPGNRFSYRYKVGGATIYQRQTTQINETPAYVVKRSLVYTLTDDGQTVTGPNRTAVAVWL